MTEQKEKDWSIYHGQELYINNHLYQVVKITELPLHTTAREIQFRLCSKNDKAPELPEAITIIHHPKPDYGNK